MTADFKQLPGVGPRLKEKLSRIGIASIEDLLFHLPLRYEDRTKIYLIKKIKPGDMCAIQGTIQEINFPQKGKTKLLIRVSDGTGFVFLRFLHATLYLSRLFKIGQTIHCFGEVRSGHLGLELIHPEYQINIPQDFSTHLYLTPIYSTTQGLSQKVLRKLIHHALHLLNQKNILQELLPSEILNSMQFFSIKKALFIVHQPDVNESLEALNNRKHPAQERLIFEELLSHRLALMQLKNLYQKQSALALKIKNNLTDFFLTRLPFQLTHAQRKVISQIQSDLTKSSPMLRLVQGDVGSGKTVVAAFAILQAIENGGQTALLAPTELLAEQHFQTFQNWFSSFKLSVALLTSSKKNNEKNTILKKLKSHEISLLIGTHAIFQSQIEFKQLVLLVIDEQHRFGVQQRALLREKGIHQSMFPHQLIMTATPIPRTLAMSLYADFDCSVIDEMPAGRFPILTRVLSNQRRKEILEHLKMRCKKGNQVYWVCALIEESEKLNCQNAENVFQYLVQALPDFKIGLLHGQMKNNEKENIMHAFRTGQLHILVATTVVEVGVDVPNANIMIIENAERFGLAQLHQLRGRVGRGQSQSFCLLVYQAPLSSLAKQRLTVMRKTTDGFKIAEEDLALRGAGEIFGTRQTGDMIFQIADVLRDNQLLPKVYQSAELIIKKHIYLSELLIRRWVSDAKKYGQVH